MYSSIGIDYAGPVYVKKISTTNDNNLHKSLIVLITCCSSRSIYLGVVYLPWPLWQHLTHMCSFDVRFWYYYWVFLIGKSVSNFISSFAFFSSFLWVYNLNFFQWYIPIYDIWVAAICSYLSVVWEICI